MLADFGMRERARNRPAEARAPASEIDVESIDTGRELQYGGGIFEAASQYLRDLRRSDDPASIRYLRAAADVDGLRALITEVRGLDRVPVRLSDAPSGRSIAHHLSERRHGVFNNRLAQGVLLLPPTFPDYMRGRSRQALRTNHRAAIAEGMSCTAVPQGTIKRAFEDWKLRQLLPDELARWYELWATNAPRDAHWYAALDASGAPVAMATVCIDTEWALLCGLVSVSRPARWLLHTHIVELLYESGTRNLCVHGARALLLPPSLQYLQRRLGYRVAHLSPPRTFELCESPPLNGRSRPLVEQIENTS